MLLNELWSIMQEDYQGKDIELAVRIRSQYERIGTVTEILRSAAERSSLSRFNGSLYSVRRATSCARTALSAM